MFDKLQLVALRYFGPSLKLISERFAVQGQELENSGMRRRCEYVSDRAIGNWFRQCALAPFGRVIWPHRSVKHQTELKLSFPLGFLS